MDDLDSSDEWYDDRRRPVPHIPESREEHLSYIALSLVPKGYSIEWIRSTFKEALDEVWGETT